MKRFYTFATGLIFIITAVYFASVFCRRPPKVKVEIHNDNMSIMVDADINIRLKRILTGVFYMGRHSEMGKFTESPVAVEFAKSSPRHLVQMKKYFFIGKFEVTQKQYARIMGYNPSKNIGAEHPVENVSWYDATKFCEKLSECIVTKQIGTVRLPTEAEWEYACRAGTTTYWNVGDSYSQSDFNGCMSPAVADYSGYVDVKSNEHTRPIGSYTANSWELYDMHGNVQEWCSDWFSFQYYSNAEHINPTGPSTGLKRICRGGSWLNYRTGSAARNCYTPEHADNDIGFRIVVESTTMPNPDELSKPINESRRENPDRLKNIYAKTIKNDGYILTNNNLDMFFVKIPAGKFNMGSPTKGEDNCFESATPQHLVEITQSFYMSMFEITQEQYEGVMGKNANYSCFRGEQLPVEVVSWHDAEAFCKKLSVMTQKTIRLPTEEEWEYACRAGSNTKYYYGNTFDPQSGNFGPRHLTNIETKPVGSYSSNSWGLYDMYGNVREWCSNYLTTNYKDNVLLEGNSIKLQVLRGGSWAYSFAQLANSAVRHGDTPQSKSYDIGFRVVFEAAEVAQRDRPE